jgi:hypothetical protein
MKNSTVNSLGGNQYGVTIEGKTTTVDLDGFTIMSDEEYKKLDEAEMIEDSMMCPEISEYSGEDPFFRAAVEYAANYSGFIAEEYITNMQE